MREEAMIKQIDNQILKKLIEIEKLRSRKKNLTQGNPYSLKENYERAKK